MKTTHLDTRPPHFAEWTSPLTIALLLLFAVLAIVGLANRLQLAQGAATAQPTPSLPIIVFATPAAAVPAIAPQVKVAAILPNTLRRAVVAYDAPAGNVIGAIEQGRAYSVLARFGVDWLQVDVAGSGVVWLMSGEVFDLPADLVDLKPQPQPQVIYQVVNQPAQEAPQQAIAPDPVYQSAPTPAQQYQVTNERQRNIQNRQVEPVYPTIAPMQMNDVNAEWARQQWRAEHP